jgi:ribose transport system substrate-binding protein
VLFRSVVVEEEVVAEEEEFTIAFTGQSNANPFWVVLRDAAQAQAKSLGVEFIDLTTAVADSAEQVKAVENAISSKVDGIIIGANDNRAFNDVIDKAQAAGITVVAVDTAIDHPYISFLVQTDNVAAAKLAGDYIVNNMESGKLLLLGGEIGHQTAEARKKGATDIVEAAGIEIIFRGCDWLEDKAYTTTLNELSANPDITAIFAANDSMALGAIAAAKEKGVLEDLLVVGFDGIQASLEAIKAGEQDATVKQDNVQMGEECVRSLVKLLKGEELETDYIAILGILITKDNVDDFISK